ncbi:MAG TPA: DNA recombination protein RmuC [Bacteroidia bacterium]|nr:DNA recombination protein RmuC [Bacteroidia bacterium]
MFDTTFIIVLSIAFLVCLALLYFYLKSNSVSKSKFDELNNSLLQIQPLLNAEKEKTEGLTKRIIEKELESKNYNGTITEITGKLGSLESELNGAKTTITNLQKDLGEFKTKNNSLKIDYDKVVGDLATANATLTAKTDELKESKLTLSDKVTEINEKAKSILELSRELEKEKAERTALNDKLNTLKEEMTKLHIYFKDQFTIQANTVLEEKSNTFKTANKTELDNILSPLKTKIEEFGKQIDADRKEEIKDITSLKSEIKNLAELNNQLSEDANKLVTALKSDSKIQGNWGEGRLKMIIENEGLERHIDYTKQDVYKSEEYETNKQPDYIIKLPESKSLIIDAKVSLKSYVDYFNSSDIPEKALHLKKHIESVKNHIDGLSSKEYQKINGINTTDYVLLFMPIENAYTLVLNENPDMFNYALNKKIIILTPTTLVATLKVVKLLWQKEQRVENIEKVFKLCGGLYDKFVGFANDMLEIKRRIRDADNAYDAAMNKLKDGRKRGETIIGRIENIRKLEATVKNKMPDAFLAEIELLETDDDDITKLIENENKEINNS